MNEQIQEQQQPTLRTRWRAIVSIFAMIGISIGLLFVDFARLGSWGYFGVFVLSMLGNATVIIPAPAFMTALAAGRTLNPWIVGVLSGVGAGIGETTGYLVGRAGRAAIGNNERFARITQHIKRWDLLAVFVFAAIPNPLMDVAGIAAGSLKMPYWKYLLACCAGKIVRFSLLALAGRYGFGWMR